MRQAFFKSDDADSDVIAKEMPAGWGATYIHWNGAGFHGGNTAWQFRATVAFGKKITEDAHTITLADPDQVEVDVFCRVNKLDDHAKAEAARVLLDGIRHRMKELGE